MNSSADQPVAPIVTQPDARRHPRFTAKVQIELHEEGSDVPIHAETSDLSRGGLYVQLNRTLALGTYVYGKLWIEGSPVEFRGRVVTRHPEFGNGIMFLLLEGIGDQLLARYLEAIAV